MSTGKYNTGFRNRFDSKKPFRNIQLGIVSAVGTIAVDTTKKEQIKEDKRFNADPYIIRCKVLGSSFDNDVPTAELSNCFPMTPKHTTVIPKLGELVLVFIFGEDEKYSDRFYLGPIISRPNKLNGETVYEGAQAGLDTGIIETPPDISKLEAAKGIYSEYDSDSTISIDGRNNSDITFKDNEVLIRGGKFVLNKPLIFNEENPAYLQLKSDFKLIKDGEVTDQTISVVNIVGDKINLLTHSGGEPRFDLTNRNLVDNLTPYITDEELNKILEDAHPLVFGDYLVIYLKLLKEAFLNHVHNGSGNKPTELTTGNNMPLEDFVTNAEAIEKAMLSKNIRIN